MENVNTQSYDYERIEKAIHFLCENQARQPKLEEVAESVHLSPYHFQRMFKKWTGTTPKKFLQYISVGHAKRLLREGEQSIFDTSFHTGLSGTSRLHDLFVNIEGMTPKAYKEGGKNLSISYSRETTPLGDIFIASTPKGICHVAFAEQGKDPLQDLKTEYPHANIRKAFEEKHKQVLAFFNQDWEKVAKIPLHVKGTPFQLKVWEALLKIPQGKLTTYGKLAQFLQAPKASRAVGTAIGKNPVAFLIPCHRVIRSTGIIGEYRWGANRKKAIICREGVLLGNEMVA